MFTLIVLIVYFGIAIIGPIIAPMLGIDPYKLDTDADQRVRWPAEAPERRHQPGAPPWRRVGDRS